MMNDTNGFTSDEKKLIEHARQRVLEICKRRKSRNLYDTIVAFVLSYSGNIYEGIPLELPSGIGFCAERHAIANMILEETEKARIKILLLAWPVSESQIKPITPCGACRMAISEFGTNETTILCSEFVRKVDGWEIFPKIWKFKIEDLYPHPWEDPWNRTQNLNKMSLNRKMK